MGAAQATALNIADGAVVTLGALPASAPAFAETFDVAGNVGQLVPEPESAIHILSALGALLGLRRRRA